LAMHTPPHPQTVEQQLARLQPQARLPPDPGVISDTCALIAVLALLLGEFTEFTGRCSPRSPRSPSTAASPCSVPTASKTPAVGRCST